MRRYALERFRFEQIPRLRTNDKVEMAPALAPHVSVVVVSAYCSALIVEHQEEIHATGDGRAESRLRISSFATGSSAWVASLSDRSVGAVLIVETARFE